MTLTSMHEVDPGAESGVSYERLLVHPTYPRGMERYTHHPSLPLLHTQQGSLRTMIPSLLGSQGGCMCTVVSVPW